MTWEVLLGSTAAPALLVMDAMQHVCIFVIFLGHYIVAFITKQKTRREFGTIIFLNKCITNRFRESWGYETSTALCALSRNWNLYICTERKHWACREKDQETETRTWRSEVIEVTKKTQKMASNTPSEFKFLSSQFTSADISLSGAEFFNVRGCKMNHVSVLCLCYAVETSIFFWSCKTWSQKQKVHLLKCRYEVLVHHWTVSILGLSTSLCQISNGNIALLSR